MSELDTKSSVLAEDSEVPVAMRKVHARLERWRSQRKGRERIPRGIWSAAGRLAREHGVNQVSRVLHLQFNQLKREAEAAKRRTGEKTRKRVAPGFMELIGSQVSSGRECVLELESPRGKLRIELRGAATAEVAGVSRALWEMLS
ncbi:MAG: hypothetical protein JOZ17_19820 [Acetobacteraceae bacterium]|nr:hypothetical protein [Acetobacteraceae bacterium]